MAQATQQSSLPTNKTNAAGIAALIAAGIVWAAKKYANIDIPPEIAALVAGAVSYGSAYLIPPSVRDHIIVTPPPQPS
jgi:hypothetical protein